ncbi:dipeptidase [Luteitalea sp. TBR-22]|uniref:dipeptidase n=1 Tax=Luteitalea sp. TBR-22 TaxID=2802971 RepID=UPI001EF5D92E|nr:membrane dipeptidase [Luteitalea sp. TBR-22]
MRAQILAAVVPFALLLSMHAQEAPRVSDQARRVHDSAFVFDGHLHMINRQLHLGGNIGDRLPDGQVDLPRMKEGGLDAFMMTLYVMEQYYPARYETKQTLRLVNMAIDQLEQNRHLVELARDADDIDRINASGRMAAVLDLEGSFDLEGDLDVLRALYRLGLRVVQLPAHNWSNEYADSCCAPARWHGLTEHGRAVVREMNRLGIVINVSHASDETIAQALEVSTDPIVATHHGLRSLNDIPRTMPDDLLRKLAAKGGVIGFHIGNAFHNRAQFDWLTRHAGKPFWDTTEVAADRARLSMAEIDKRLIPQFPMVEARAPEELLMSVDQWVGVVDRAIQLVGEDHVALGSDFDGGPTPPRGMRDVRDIAMITDAMLRRGYSEARIRKFLGGNLLRVFRQVTNRQR